MKYLGFNGAWKKLAIECLKHAVKEGDFDSVFEPEFPLLCDLADVEENEVIVNIRHSADMISLYGRHWYRKGV